MLKKFFKDKKIKNQQKENEAKFLAYVSPETKKLKDKIAEQIRISNNFIRTDFLYSLNKQLDERGFLTPKQIDALTPNIKIRISDRWSSIDQEIDSFETYNDWEASLDANEFDFISSIPNRC